MLPALLDQLKNPTPEVRIDALCALVMLEETNALGVLGQMWRTETHAEVRQAIRWAGTQIQAASQRGYTTEVEMAKAFRLDRAPTEEEQAQARKEQQLLASIQTKAAVEQTKQHGTESSKGTGNLLRRAATAGAISAAFGLGAGLTASMMGSPVSASSNLPDGSDRPQIGKEPIVPARPSTMNMAMPLKKLTDANPQTRKSAILQLRDLNNPAALGALGRCFVTDLDPSVREAAQATGKLIYFSALYWQKRATGSLQ